MLLFKPTSPSATGKPYQPAAQMVQAEAPAAADLPAAQLVHAAEPVTLLYVPAAQAVHVPPSGPVYPDTHRHSGKVVHVRVQPDAENESSDVKITFRNPVEDEYPLVPG